MRLENIRILVTGITGTLGTRIALRLIPEALEVRGLYRTKEQTAGNIPKGLLPIIGELNDQSSLVAAMKDVDLLIHCAAYLGDDPVRAEEANVTGISNLAKAATHAGVKRIIHLSTTSVYGETDGHFTEESPTSDTDQVYIKTKILSERILLEETPHTDVIILRPGAICAEVNSHWGDHQVRRMKMADYVTWVHPEDIVPWVHADNLVEMIILTLSKGRDGDIFNAIDLNVPETSFRMRLIEASGRPYHIPNRSIERPTYSNDKMYELGYRPIRSFEKTMEELISSFRT